MRISDWSSDVCSSDLPFNLPFTEIDGKQVAVTERIECRKTFGQLKHFVREGRESDPKLLVVAPMSGHFATLLRGTVERMLPRHDVYITDRSEEHTSELQSLMRN